MDRGRDAGGSWDPLPGDVRVCMRRARGSGAALRKDEEGCRGGLG